MMRVIRAVVFDVGECIVNQTCEQGHGPTGWAFRGTRFSAVLVPSSRGLDYRETFQVFRPGFDHDEERRLRAAAGQPEKFGEDDLYPDA